MNPETSQDSPLMYHGLRALSHEAISVACMQVAADDGHVKQRHLALNTARLRHVYTHGQLPHQHMQLQITACKMPAGLYTPLSYATQAA